jgi:hypothetical protein
MLPHNPYSVNTEPRNAQGKATDTPRSATLDDAAVIEQVQWAKAGTTLTEQVVPFMGAGHLLKTDFDV